MIPRTGQWHLDPKAVDVIKVLGTNDVTARRDGLPLVL